MNVLQLSCPKSGTFWLSNIIGNILNEADIPEKSYVKAQPVFELAKPWGAAIGYPDILDMNQFLISNQELFYRIFNIFVHPIEDFDDYLKNVTNVYCHSLACHRTAEVVSKFDKTVYIIRDPRDVAISWAKFTYTPVMLKYYYFVAGNDANPEIYLNKHFNTMISDWMSHVIGYLNLTASSNIHVTFYEQLSANFDQELAKMLDHLEIDLSADAIQRIKNAVDFTEMKKKNPDHIREGGYYKWKNILTEAQKAQCLQQAEPVLRFLNYPISDDSNALPVLPDKMEDLSHLSSGRSICLNCEA